MGINGARRRIPVLDGFLAGLSGVDCLFSYVSIIYEARNGSGTKVSDPLLFCQHIVYCNSKPDAWLLD